MVVGIAQGGREFIRAGAAKTCVNASGVAAIESPSRFSDGEDS